METAMPDHPHTDPGDGRTECQTCGKWVFEAIHSCKGVPVTEAAVRREAANLATFSSDDLLDEYRDEVVRMCAHDGPERLKARAAIRSEILRRLRLVEPKRFT